MIKIIVAILGACCTFAVQAESFYGIEIGGPFSVRECTSDDLEMGKNVEKGLCTRSKGASLTQHPWSAVTHQIDKPFGMQFASWGFQPYGFSVKEFQGAVIEISVATFGADWQEEALKDLKTKFGNPQRVNKTPLQNMFGVKVMKLSALWRKPGYTVSFEGISGSRDTGFISIKSDGAASEKRAADEWRAKNSPQPKM